MLPRNRQTPVKLELNHRFAAIRPTKIVPRRCVIRIWRRKLCVADRSDIRKLTGLVLAGGRSVRMGEDKGSIDYGSGRPQVSTALEHLVSVCGTAWVSINRQQASQAPYASLPTIVDTGADQGPAGGLASALELDPNTAWLVLAVDMPRVTRSLLNNLVAQRDPQRIATVHCHADGVIEPLCAIWEAHARDRVLQELASGRGSLRALAQECAAAIARLPEPEQIRSANTPAERMAMQDSINAEKRAAGEIGRNGA